MNGSEWQQMEKKNEEINQQPTNEGRRRRQVPRLRGDFHLKNLKHGEERKDGRNRSGEQ